jgi:hypothetical protein
VTEQHLAQYIKFHCTCPKERKKIPTYILWLFLTKKIGIKIFWGNFHQIFNVKKLNIYIINLFFKKTPSPVRGYKLFLGCDYF